LQNAAADRLANKWNHIIKPGNKKKQMEHRISKHIVVDSLKDEFSSKVKRSNLILLHYSSFKHQLQIAKPELVCFKSIRIRASGVFQGVEKGIGENADREDRFDHPSVFFKDTTGDHRSSVEFIVQFWYESWVAVLDRK
jgi:hypothetical protein